MCSSVYSLHAWKCAYQSHTIYICEGTYSISIPLRTDTFRTICLHYQRQILGMGVYGVLYGDTRDPSANSSVCDVVWPWWSVHAGMCVTYIHILIYVTRLPSPWHCSLFLWSFQSFCMQWCRTSVLNASHLWPWQRHSYPGGARRRSGGDVVHGECDIHLQCFEPTRTQSFPHTCTLVLLCLTPGDCQRLAPLFLIPPHRE